MLNKYQIQSLMEQNKSFIIYGIILGLKIQVDITWIATKDTYKIYADGKIIYSKNIDEILQIRVCGYSLEQFLPAGNVLVADRNLKAEEIIIRKYIRPKYQERCRYILSGKNSKNQGFSRFLANRPSLLREESVEQIIEKDMDACTQIFSRIEIQKVGKKKGYLITGYFDDKYYSGTIQQLAEYLLYYEPDNFGIIYHESRFGVLQFQYDDLDNRFYWLL